MRKQKLCHHYIHKLETFMCALNNKDLISRMTKPPNQNSKGTNLYLVFRPKAIVHGYISFKCVQASNIHVCTYSKYMLYRQTTIVITSIVRSKLQDQA
jgi:hypothetical protein